MFTAPMATRTGLYRAARVALVTPLRDGMNLVAKEYVASRNPDDPGVLILSRFAGAAQERKAGSWSIPMILRALRQPSAKLFRSGTG